MREVAYLTLIFINFSTGCEPDAFEPTLCYIASINNHQEQEQAFKFGANNFNFIKDRLG